MRVAGFPADGELDQAKQVNQAWINRMDQPDLDQPDWIRQIGSVRPDQDVLISDAR
jgi:hypothetical protein